MTKFINQFGEVVHEINDGLYKEVKGITKPKLRRSGLTGTILLDKQWNHISKILKEESIN